MINTKQATEKHIQNTKTIDRIRPSVYSNLLKSYINTQKNYSLIENLFSHVIISSIFFNMFYLIVIAAIVLLGVYNFYWKRRNYPNGPTPLPLLGNLLSFGDFYGCYLRWKKEYGPVKFWGILWKSLGFFSIFLKT